MSSKESQIVNKKDNSVYIGHYVYHQGKMYSGQEYDEKTSQELEYRNQKTKHIYEDLDIIDFPAYKRLTGNDGYPINYNELDRKIEVKYSHRTTVQSDATYVHVNVQQEAKERLIQKYSYFYIS